ncbi:MAG: hypothetical protein KJN85_15030 [Maribacter sp.]|nr:hypothetical protein [Maribacter sp.]NNK17993.1 hypothetical protein [Maribacter sp.]
MKSIGCALLLFIASMFLGHCQSKTTKETKVILVVEGTSDGITQMVLFNTFEKMKGNQIFGKFPNCQFYIGLLQGRYELKEDRVIPSLGSTIIMYTDRQYLSSKTLSPSDGYSVGDQLKLGLAKAKVVSNNKGELILKTQ